MRKIITGAVMLAALLIPAGAMAYTVHVKPMQGKALAAALHAKRIGIHNKVPDHQLQCYVGFQQKVAPGPGTGGITKAGVVAYSNWAMQGSEQVLRKQCGGDNQKVVNSSSQVLWVTTENNPNWTWGPWLTFWGWRTYPPDTRQSAGTDGAEVQKPVANVLIKALDRYSR